VNKIRKSERFSRLLAFLLSGIFYICAGVLLFSGIKRGPDRPSVFMPAPVNLSFAQPALQAAEPPPEVRSQPVADPVSEQISPEPVQPEIPAKPAVPVPEVPEPVSKPAEIKARVTQEASAEVSVPVRNILLAWVRAQIEKEKYYPAAARNAGYEGRFRLLVKVRADGVIAEAVVLDGRGHPILRRSLEKITAGLTGRNSGLIPGAPVELPFDFEFKLTGAGR